MMRHSSSEWNKRFIKQCQLLASWSKDPRTKCGAVIVLNKRIISQGFNGLAQRLDDSDDRLYDRVLKKRIVLHAEENAILFAAQPLIGCDIYTWPIPPCPKCASFIIQVGISRVFYGMTELSMEKKDDIALTEELLNEAGVQLIPLTYEGV